MSITVWHLVVLKAGMVSIVLYILLLTVDHPVFLVGLLNPSVPDMIIFLVSNFLWSSNCFVILRNDMLKIIFS